MELKSLKELRVLDVSQVLAGPLAAMMLGDLGCDVIKVEPLDGDATRRTFGTKAEWGEPPGYLSVNRNKRSISLNLKSDQGLSVLQALAVQADVIIENFRPGVAERLGVGYDQLKRLNKGLVFCSISGFGNSRPYSDRGGYDMMAQAMSGIMSVTGEAGGPPARSGVPVADVGAGLVATVGILGALIAREQTGEGCIVETNLLEAAMSYAVWDSTHYWASGEVASAMGSAHQMNAPYQAFRSKDGFVTVGANNQGLWEKLCDALDHAEWKTDPRFESQTQRVIHRNELADAIEATMGDMTRAEVEARLDRFHVPVGAVRTYDEVFDSEGDIEDGMVEQANYAGSNVRIMGSPIKIDGVRLGVRLPPPELGQHTDEVLGWLGMTPEEIMDLHAKGVVNS